MKAKFKYGIKAYSGKLDDIVFSHYSKRDVTIGRVDPEKREITDHNHEIGIKMQIISQYYNLSSDEFKEDLAKYADAYNSKYDDNGKLGVNKYSIFVKLLCKIEQKPANGISLTSVDGVDVVAVNDAIGTIKNSVEEGYLPTVEGYEELTHPTGLN